MAIVPTDKKPYTFQKPTTLQEELNDFIVDYINKDSNIDRETGPQTPPRMPVYHHHPIDQKMAEIDRDNTSNKDNDDRIVEVTNQMRDVLSGIKRHEKKGGILGTDKKEILPQNQKNFKYNFPYKEKKISPLPPGS